MPHLRRDVKWVFSCWNFYFCVCPSVHQSLQNPKTNYKHCICNSANARSTWKQSALPSRAATYKGVSSVSHSPASIVALCSGESMGCHNMFWNRHLVGGICVWFAQLGNEPISNFVISVYPHCDATCNGVQPVFISCWSTSTEYCNKTSMQSIYPLHTAACISEVCEN